jgi:cytochrome c oxidase assembly protein subunit 15
MVDKSINRLAFGTTLLAFIVVVLGAYTRLTDAGLGCPDWPGCYGKLVPETNSINPLINTTKAWTEMIHRYLAGLLGLVIFTLSAVIFKNRVHFKKKSIILGLAVSVLVIFQALLGMWTVTLKLLPVVVMAHLLGGLATLSLLWWLFLTLYPNKTPVKINPPLRFWSIAALVALILQISLGGWTSANYAALVCLDFPFCNNTHNRILSLLETIHMLHRVGALLTSLVIVWLAFLIWRSKNTKPMLILAPIIFTLLMMQLFLGITNVLALLPLPIAVAHNAVAALLLLSLVTVNYFIYE